MKKGTIFIIVLGLCLSGGNALAAKEGGTLVIAMEGEAGILDPHLTQGWMTMRVNSQIFDGLVQEDMFTEKMPIPLVPGLAKSWDISEDGLTYTFHLREGVKFHDGTPFNAQAVEFNIRRCIDPNFEYYYKMADANTKKLYGVIKDIKVIDDHTVQMIFKEPYRSFARLNVCLTMGSGGMLSPTALKKYGNEGFANHPVGTGPFMFVERVRGEKIVLKRNPNYWGQKPYVDSVIFRTMDEAATRISALQTGGADIVCVPPPDSVEILEKQGFQVSKGPIPAVWLLHFNFKNEIMMKPKVRQAINMAINRRQLSDTLLRGTAMPAFGLLVPGDPAFDPKYEPYPYDPEKAKQLLAEAGYPNGFETTLQTSVGGSGQIMPVAIAEWIQRDLEKIGIKLKLDTYEWVTYIGLWAKGMVPEIGINQISWGFPTPFLLNLVAQTKWHGPVGQNSGFYSNADVDKWITMAEHAKTDEDYFKFYKMAHDQIMKDAAFCPIVHDLGPYLLDARVKGFVHVAEHWFSCIPIYLEK